MPRAHASGFAGARGVSPSFEPSRPSPIHLAPARPCPASRAPAPSPGDHAGKRYVEPGGFETDWNGSSATRADALPAYAELKEKLTEARKTSIGRRGDPRATGAAILKIVDAKEPPLRIFFGAAPLGMAKADYEKRLATWEAWDAVSREAQGN